MSEGILVERPLAGPTPALAEATGDLVLDLPSALDWWDDVAARADGPIVLVLDQAEQIDALAHDEARDAADAAGREIEAALSPVWLRFTGLLAALSGRLLDENRLPDTLQDRIATARRDAPLRVILGLHRRSALDLWPLSGGAVPGRDEVTLEPLATDTHWDAVIRGTCAAYGLEMDEGLLQDMKGEAAQLAKARDEAQAPEGAGESGTDVVRSSVLPQVVTALQRMLEAWRARHGETGLRNALTPNDMVLSRSEYSPFAKIAEAIDALGESAWRDWQDTEARASGTNLEGYFSRKRLAEEQDRKFAMMMSRLVDARSGGKQDLTYLPNTSLVAEEQAVQIAALRRKRLITNVEGDLRLPHRAILDHWDRARDWLRSAEARLETKARLATFLAMGEDLPPSHWPDDKIESLARLALDWIGSGHGEDAARRDALRAALVERFVVADCTFSGDTLMQALPFHALLGGERALFDALFEKCLMSLDLPKIAESLCLQFSYAGDTDSLSRLIAALGPAARAVVDAVNETDGSFPLVLAAQNGHAAVVAALLKAGAEVNRVHQTNGSFPLLLAAQNGHADVATVLLKAGAQVNRINPITGSLPLIIAAQQGHAQVVTALLAAGAEVNRVDTSGAFPLLQAAQNGHADVVAALLAAGAQVNQTCEIDGSFPLFVAAHEGHADVVAALLAAGAQVNKGDQSVGGLPLIIAAQQGHAEVVAALLAAGAEVNRVDTSGAFPVLQAAQNGHADVVTALLAAGAEVDRINPVTGIFSLLMAAQNGHADVATALLAAGAQVNQVEPIHGGFPLLQAALSGHADMVSILIVAGAEVNRTNKPEGIFPLLMAAQLGHADAVKALLAAGAQVNRSNETNGGFPLLMAAQQGHADVVATLLAAGAQVNQTHEINGSFPLLLAAQNGHADAVTALLAARAEINQVEINGRFPLLQAAQEGHADVVAALLKAGAEVDKVHKSTGMTALGLAALGRHAHLVRLLTERGASINSLPKELAKLLQDFLNDNADPLSVDAFEDEQAQALELPLPPVSGKWSYANPDKRFQRSLTILLETVDIPTDQFRVLLDLRMVRDHAGLGFDLCSAAFVITDGTSDLVLDVLWIDAGGDYPPALIGPGCDLQGVLIDLLEPTRTSSDEAVEAIAQLALITMPTPAYLIADAAHFSKNHAEPLKRGGYAESMWHETRTIRDGKDRRVELSAVQNDRLLRLSVDISLSPFCIQTPSIISTLATGVAPDVIPFAQVRDAHEKFRVIGEA
jgi:ankyrin repeat protein